MLWLPKWMEGEDPPQPGAVSRRTFLFLGGAAVVGALLPSPTILNPAEFEWGRVGGAIRYSNSLDAVLKAHYLPEVRKMLNTKTSFLDHLARRRHHFPKERLFR